MIKTMTNEPKLLPSSLEHKVSTFRDPNNFPALSLWQPYAGLVWLTGMGYRGKEIETRTVKITYRGPLVITAAKKTDPLALDYAQQTLVGPGHISAELFDRACGSEFAGKAVAVFEVNGCRTMYEADHLLALTNPKVISHHGRYIYEADKITALEPFAVHNRQGFFRVSRIEVKSAEKHTTTHAERLEARRAYAALNSRKKAMEFMEVRNDT